MLLRPDVERTMLITGTSRGIGLGLAEWYLRRGYFVFGCSRSKSACTAPCYEHFSLDVCDENSVLDLFSQIRNRCSRLDVLVNNAGIGSMNHALTTPVSSVDRIMRTNFTSTFLFSREAAKLMMSARQGRIVNFTTVAVPFALEGEAAYVASKAAVESLTRTLAREFADFGVTVNAVGPTPVVTDMIRAVPKSKIDSLLRRQAISRLGTTEDVANVVDFFIRPESEFVTGQIVYLGGL